MKMLLICLDPSSQTCDMPRQNGSLWIRVALSQYPSFYHPLMENRMIIRVTPLIRVVIRLSGMTIVLYKKH